MHKFELLEELALANAETLFELWGLEYKKISPDEYDFLNPTRNDNSFGACRFNVKKGKGADFAGVNLTKADFKNLGLDFDETDFVESNSIQTNWGFNIIGLCQRLHGIKTYREAAQKLHDTLTELHRKGELYNITIEQIQKKQNEVRQLTEKKIATASKTWANCRTYKDTYGEVYLNSRGIYLLEDEPNIKYHNRVYNSEIKKLIPALLFKVSKAPDSELTAIHRIYLKQDGSGKANLNEAKLALGPIQGSAIWFGTPCDELGIGEGPENALAIRSIGVQFVCSTINGANFSSLLIPEYVKKVILFPDPDEAGKAANVKAAKNYIDQGKSVRTVWPPKNNNPKWDWADELKSRGIDVE